MLIGAGVRSSGGPLRYLGAPLAQAVERNTWAQAGARRNWWAGQATVVAGASIADKSSVPDGLLHPGSWLMAPKPGGMSSRGAGLTLDAAGLAAGGITTTGAASMTLEATNSSRLPLDDTSPARTASATFSISFADAVGELISSGEGAATLTISTNNPLLTASIGGTGAATLTISTNNPLLSADADIAGTASFSLSGSLSPYAVGSMSGSTVDNTVLTSDTLASAVWSRAIEAGFSAEQILRIIAAHAAGAATGLEGSNPMFLGLDGSTVRIDGTYSAGTRTIDALDGA